MYSKNFYKILARYSWDVFAVMLMLWGIIAFLTPLTPGSWLFFFGLVILFGKKGAERRVTSVIGRKWFNKLKIKRIFKKIPSEISKDPKCL